MSNITDAARAYIALGSYVAFNPLLAAKVATETTANELKKCDPDYGHLVRDALDKLTSGTNILQNVFRHMESKHAQQRADARQVVIDAIKEDKRIYEEPVVMRPGRCITIDPFGTEFLTMDDTTIVESPSDAQLNATFERWIYVVGNNDAYERNSKRSRN